MQHSGCETRDITEAFLQILLPRGARYPWAVFNLPLTEVYSENGMAGIPGPIAPYSCVEILGAKYVMIL
jgi:hypothetical protein